MDRPDASTDEEALKVDLPTRAAILGRRQLLFNLRETQNRRSIRYEVQGRPMIAGSDHGAPFHQSFEPQQQ
jgi:hypothetical protein